MRRGFAAMAWTRYAAMASVALAAGARGQAFEYEDEALFLQDLASMGYDALVEDFEGAAWDDYRTTNPFDPQAAPVVTSRGLAWSGNDWITTNTNWGRNGSWGVFTASIVGGWPESFHVESAQTLHGAGGWINSNPDFGADMGIVIDGEVVAERNIGTGHQFLGVIVPGGFTTVEFVDLEQQAAIGADDFTFGVVASCAADCNGDGELNVLDFVCFQGLFTSGDGAADCTGDGALNVLDFVCFQGVFVGGCP